MNRSSDVLLVLLQTALEDAGFDEEADLDKAIRVLEISIKKTKKSDLDLDGAEEVSFVISASEAFRLFVMSRRRENPLSRLLTYLIKIWTKSKRRRNANRG